MKFDQERALTMLIVEDIDWIRSGMKQAAEQCGYLVAEAKNNLEALDLAQYHLPDLILSEEEVPGFASLIKSVNEDIVTRNLPIVIVNPDADEGARVGEAFVVNDYDRIALLLTGPRE